MKPSFAIACLITSGASLWSTPAHAMHISEGLLPASWAGLWTTVALPFLLYGLWQVRRRTASDLELKPLLGITAAAVFIISCMPVPVPTAGTCSHPCGTAISALLIGPVLSVPVAAAALLIQALFLAHGGLSTWGANIVSMGIVGSFAGWAVFRLARRMGIGLGGSAFAAGLLADWATYSATSFELASALSGNEPVSGLFFKIASAFVPTQLPLGVLEGFMTAGAVTLLSRRRPDILVRFKILKPEEVTA